MKATFGFVKPAHETITIPEQFEFVYDDAIHPTEYTDEQWKLWEKWRCEVLPQLLGPEAINIDFWEVFPDD